VGRRGSQLSLTTATQEPDSRAAPWGSWGIASSIAQPEEDGAWLAAHLLWTISSALSLSLASLMVYLHCQLDLIERGLEN
jgi:hypothetical protein